ncbi:response regulator transcription factor [Thalassobacillus hwangdonensis]|uniref:Response regulator transcription factor n=1 Tax=Thalassobacillus hwangdonensis TaxID=546108 RepID=A0ABW3L4Z7_9BACI
MLKVVNAYLLSPQDINDLIYAIDTTINHENFSSDQIDRLKSLKLEFAINEKDIVNHSDFRKSLTAREDEVLSHLLNGANSLNISKSLHISEHTAKAHIKNIYKKLDVNGKSELILRYT